MLLYLFRSSIPLQVIDRLFTKILKNSKNYVCWVLVGIVIYLLILSIRLWYRSHHDGCVISSKYQYIAEWTTEPCASLHLTRHVPLQD